MHVEAVRRRRRPARARRGAAALAGFAAAFAFAAAAALGSGSAQAQPKPETLAACAACHGPNGNAPVEQFPSIAGQPRVFLENTLVLIREGLREVPAMQPVMAGMGDDEIVALAKHFAAQPPVARPVAVQAAKAEAGKRAAAGLLCGTCHLATFAGQNQVPRLAGQNEAYLLASMKQFRDNPGPGRDTIMSATLRGVTDADLANLAHHLAAFKP